MTHQGYIGSLGTSAMLVAAAVSILLIVGTIVAFEGFPGPSVDDSTDAFPVQGFTSEPPAPERVTASPAPPSPAASAATAAPAPAAAAVEVEEAAVEPPASSAPVLPTTPDAPAPPPTDDQPTVSDTGGSSGGGGTPSLSETLTDTTRTLESTVERVLPVTEPVVDTLHRLGR